jgi:hypothetical protein
VDEECGVLGHDIVLGKMSGKRKRGMGKRKRGMSGDKNN